MQMRLPALRNYSRLLLFFLPAALSCPCRLWAQNENEAEVQWYRSNKSGLALELIPSRLAALREEHSLRIRSISLRETPELLYAYYNVSFVIEERTLFENGDEERKQFLFRDQRGRTRLNASFSPDFFSPVAEPLEDEDFAETKTGFIEVYNEGQFITLERVFSPDGSEAIVHFFYNEGMLVRTESWKLVTVPTEPLMVETSLSEPSRERAVQTGPVLQFVDFYRYSRANYLRAVERVYHVSVEEDKSRFRISFPALGPGIVPSIEFDVPHMPVDFGGDDAFEIPQGNRVTYATDSRGRALRETRTDEDGNIVGEVENNWTGDRLSTVTITAGDEERIVEFEYNSAGNRIMERNFRNGVLERTVRSDGDRDTEELYMNGVLILRAIWEGGRKISEERIRPGGNSR